MVAADALASEAEQNESSVLTVLASSTEGVVSIDSAGNILSADQGAAAMFGYSGEELVGNKIEVLIPERFRSRHIGHREAFFRHPHLRQLGSGVRFIGQRKDGSEFAAAIALQYSEGDSGEICSALITDTSLRRSERWFTLFLDHVPGAIAMFDREMRYVATSRRWLTDYRITENPIGRSQYDLFPEIPESWKEAYRRGLAGENCHCDGEAFVRRDGTVQWVKWDLSPWWEVGGEIGGILISAEDITAQKQFEQNLRSSEERLKLAVTGTSDGIWDWNLTTNEVYWSDRTFEMLGFAPGEVPSHHRGLKLVHPEDLERVSRSFRAHADQGLPYNAEYRLQTKCGEYRWFSVRGAVVRDEDGTPQRMAGSITDITERVRLKQRLEEVLQNTDEQLRVLIEASPLAIGAIDREGRILSWNHAAERIYGYKAAEVIGRINPAIPATERENYQQLLAEVLSGKAQRLEVKRIRKDGTEFDAALHYSRFLERPGGEPSGVVVFAEDITLRKRAEEEVRLNGVRAALVAAQDDEARRIARELHDDISQRLAVLSIDMSVDAGRKRISREWKARLQNYREKVQSITESIRQLSHQMHATILDELGLVTALEQLCLEASNQWLGFPVTFRAEDVADNLPKTIASCVYRVAQAALHNVAKHARAKDATVTLKGCRGFIELIIADSGKGFDTTVEQKGLGLASMRERVRLLNGTISLESKPGDGTVVGVKLPTDNVVP